MSLNPDLRIWHQAVPPIMVILARKLESHTGSGLGHFSACKEIANDENQSFNWGNAFHSIERIARGDLPEFCDDHQVKGGGT